MDGHALNIVCSTWGDLRPAVAAGHCREEFVELPGQPRLGPARSSW